VNNILAELHLKPWSPDLSRDLHATLRSSKNSQSSIHPSNISQPFLFAGRRYRIPTSAYFPTVFYGIMVTSRRRRRYICMGFAGCSGI
jgi:hypothetical protein